MTIFNNTIYQPLSFFTAIHNWHGDVRFGLALDVGDSVEILEECKNWYRGTCARKSRAVGIFPKTYIHIKELSKIDPVVAECTQVLREWSEIWKKLYVVCTMKKKKLKLYNIFVFYNYVI